MKYILSISFLLLISCGVKETQKAPRGEALLTFAPKNSNFIVYSDIRGIVESNIIKDEMDHNISSLSPESKKQYDEFINMTGLDVKRDFHEVLFAGKSAIEEAEKNFIVAISATFDGEKLIAYAQAKAEEKDEPISVTKESVNDATLYTITSENADNMQNINVAFINNKTILLGDKEAIIESITQTESALNNIQLMEKLDQVSSNHFYALLEARELQISISEENPYRNAIGFLDNVAFAMNFDDQVHLSVLSNCLEAAQAEEVEKIVKGAIGVLRLGLSAERDLIDLMNEVKIERENKNVTVRLDIDRKRLDMLKNYKPKVKKQI
jgi:hypothetical protein